MRPKQRDEEKRGLGQTPEEESENENNKLQMLKVQKRGMFRPAYKWMRMKTDGIASDLEAQDGRWLAGLFTWAAWAQDAFERAALQIEHFVICDICTAVLGNVLTLKS